MEIDYEKLNFKAGLEIHQQLDTHKLFCSCPSVLRVDEPKFKVTRKLHAVRGESGGVDVAAKFQAGKNKEYIYEGYDTTCLVELDEEPPHKINQEALKIATQISLLLNCKMVPLTQIMRKTVVDGSNTSGFQRTVLISRGGYVDSSRGRVGINFILLEEDSARTVKKTKDSITYRLDRLGLPLVEIVTSPDLKDANHAKEVALKIGEIVRSCKVRRGIGTIRQDLNVSIRGENRVELKGMQDMDVFVKAVETEVLRQKELSDNKNPVSMEVRVVKEDGHSEFLRPMPGHSRMYPETDLPLLKIRRDFVNEVKKDLPKLRSEIEAELKKQGLTQDFIKMIFKRDLFFTYKDLIETGASSRIVSKVLLLFPREISKKNDLKLEEVESILNKDVLIFILESLREEKIQEGDLKIVLDKIVSGIPLKEAIKLDKKDLLKVEEDIEKIIKEKPGLSPNAYMGLVMKNMKGTISGGDAMKIINKLLK